MTDGTEAPKATAAYSRGAAREAQGDRPRALSAALQTHQREDAAMSDSKHVDDDEPRELHWWEHWLVWVWAITLLVGAIVTGMDACVHHGR